MRQYRIRVLTLAFKIEVQLCTLIRFVFYSLDKLKPKIKTKTKVFFVGVNENSTTFLYTIR